MKILISVFNQSETELDITEIVADAMLGDITPENTDSALQIASAYAVTHFGTGDVDAYTD